MSYIVFASVLIPLWVLRRHGLEKAFLWAWIPVFLCMPTMFTAKIPMVPLRTFMQAWLVPLLFVLLRDKRSEMTFGRMEMLLLAYVLVRVFCDFLGRGYSDAQNYAAYMLVSLIGPYLIGRYVINRREMDVATARMFVLMFVLFFPLFLYELKFWVSPIYQIFSPMFPEAFSGLSVRWGLARTAGTFEHPILAAIMIIAVYRLHRWLCWIGAWDAPQTGWLGRIEALMRRFPFSFKTQISIALILMILLTLSRGPWIGALAGAALVAVGNTKNRKKWLIILGMLFVLGGLGGKMALDAYMTPQLGEVLSDEAQTMLYRSVMIDQYKAFLMDKMWTGWGLTTVPKIPGMESVDNAFFLMALQHGLIAPAVFIMIFVYAIASQIKFGLKAASGESPIGFTFSGIYLVCFVAFATVYMGAQTEPLIFLMLGWGESIKRRHERPGSGTAPASNRNAPAPQRVTPFKRVLY
jgi:hypothetical protein